VPGGDTRPEQCPAGSGHSWVVGTLQRSPAHPPRVMLYRESHGSTVLEEPGEGFALVTLLLVPSHGWFWQLKARGDFFWGLLSSDGGREGAWGCRGAAAWG